MNHAFIAIFKKAFPNQRFVCFLSFRFYIVNELLLVQGMV